MKLPYLPAFGFVVSLYFWSFAFSGKVTPENSPERPFYINASQSEVTSETEFNLSLSTNLMITASATLVNNVSCNGGSDGSAEAQAMGGFVPYTYLWDNGETNAVATALNAGLHTGTVTDAIMASATFEVTISEPTPIAVSPTNIFPADCNASNGVAQVSVTGGNPGYSYLWDNGQTSNPAFNFSAGPHTLTVTDMANCEEVWNFVISENNTIQISSTTVNAQPNCNASDGVASVTWTGGTPPFDFLWDTGETTNPAFNLDAGLHTGTITDANTCTATFDVLLTENNTIQVSSTTVNAQPNCNASDGVASVTWTGGTPPFDFLWDTGETTNPAFNLDAGLHTGTITDANTCTATFDVVLTENNTIQVSSTTVNAQPNCNASDGVASVTWTGGTPPFDFLWDTGETTNPAFNLDAGLHTGTITDANTCTATFDVVLTENNTIQVSSTTVNAQPNCNADDGVASVQFTGGVSPVSLLWDNGATTNPAFNLSPGLHTGTITDANSCTATFDVLLTEANTIQISSTLVITQPSCNASNGVASVNFTGGVAPIDILWDNGSNTNPGFFLDAGLHTGTITDVNSCTATFDVLLTENNTLAISSTTILVPANCGEPSGIASVDIDGGTTPYTYLWDTGESTNPAFLLTAGPHTGTVTDAGGCTIEYGLIMPQNSSFQASTLTISDASCSDSNNGSVMAVPIDGIPPYTYAWDNGETTETAVALGPGPHSLTITDGVLCVATKNFSVGAPPPISSFTGLGQNLLCDDFDNGEAFVSVFGGVPPYDYLWDNGETTSLATGLANGTRTVTITDANGCTKTDFIDIGAFCQPVHDMTTDICSASGPIFSFGDGIWQNIFFNNELIGAINDNGNFLGIVNMEFYINSGPIRVDDNPFLPMEYMDRNFNITPEVQPVTPVSVRLYFTGAELTKYFLANDGDNNDISSTTAFNEITFTKYDGSNEDCSLEGNDGVASGGIHSLFPIGDIIHGTYGLDYFIQFDINSFSEFYLHGNSPNPLPIDLISFTGNAEKQGNLLEWSTAAEINTDYFDIQRSVNGIHFESIGNLPASGNSEVPHNYEFLDTRPGTLSYYRLAVIDLSGEVHYSDIIVIERPEREGNLVIVPNPSPGTVTVEYFADSESWQQFHILTITGNLEIEKAVDALPGINRLELDLNHLAPGIYIIRHYDGKQTTPHKLILMD